MRHLLTKKNELSIGACRAALFGGALALCATPGIAQVVKKQAGGPELNSPLSAGNDTDVPATGDLAYGAYQRGYYLTALNLALARADAGDPAAQTLIAEIYWNGQGVARDRKQAAEWYKFAAASGNSSAQFAYANILLRGQLVPEDLKAGRELLQKAADAGHTRAQFNLAQVITAERPTWGGFKRALPWYQKAADAGLPDAQYALANIYAEAKGVNTNDEVKARKWLAASAEGGLDSAQVEYGIWLVNGRGGPKDEKAAFSWFQRASAQRNVLAQNRLARLYSFGVGTKADPIKAGAWHILAKRAGHNDAQMNERFAAMEKIDQRRAIELANRFGRRLR